MTFGFKHQLLLAVFILVCSCSGSPDEVVSKLDKNTEPREVDTTSRRMSSKIIFTDSIGWGYQIYKGSKLEINQPHIPSLPTNKGFKSREAAQLTANFILYKLSRNIFPPRITPKEMDSLGVIKQSDYPGVSFE